MIAEIAVLTIEDDKIPLIEALVPLRTLYPSSSSSLGWR